MGDRLNDIKKKIRLMASLYEKIYSEILHPSVDECACRPSSSYLSSAICPSALFKCFEYEYFIRIYNVIFLILLIDFSPHYIWAFIIYYIREYILMRDDLADTYIYEGRFIRWNVQKKKRKVII